VVYAAPKGLLFERSCGASFFHDRARAYDGFLYGGIAAAAFFVLEAGTNVKERPFEGRVGRPQ